MVLSPERFAADVARIRPFVRVCPDVYEQIIGFAELPVTVGTNVSFLRLAAGCCCYRLANHGHGSHLFLDVPRQCHGPDVAFHLTGWSTAAGVTRERARMLSKSRPNCVHVH